jgi:acyl carrier protein
MTDDIAGTVRQFVLSKYLPGESADNLPDDLPLQSSGILDSLAALGLVTFLEEQYGIELDVYDTAVERFDSIRDVAATVQRKRAGMLSGEGA